MADTRQAQHEGAVTVTERSAAGFAQQVTVNGHELTIDEPEPDGGGTGPTPYDMLLAGLGGCTAMTVRMYADRKGWPLRHVSVSLRHSRIHARDCENCETEAGLVDRIEREVRLEGDLDDDQRARLMDIADKCPVHRTLTTETVIESTLVAGG